MTVTTSSLEALAMTQIYGGRGNAGTDRIFGDDGDDYLNDRPGDDVFNGGTGRNELVD